MSGKGTLKNFKTMLAEAKLPERTVMICLRGDLAAEHEHAERELAEAAKTASDSLAGSGVGEIADRIDALEGQMREHSYEFRLRALKRPDWRALVDQHQPRKGDDGLVVPTDRIGVDVSTFYDAILRACLVDPELTDEEFAQLLDSITDRQYDELTEAAWALNRKEVDIPFSRAASEVKRISAGE
jgi:hypothetical protein